MTGFCQDLAGFTIDEVISHEPAVKLIFRHEDLGDTLFGDLVGRTLGDLGTSRSNNFAAFGIDQIEDKLLANVTLDAEIGNPTILGAAVFSRLIVIVEDFFRGQTFDFRRIDRAAFFGTLCTGVWRPRERRKTSMSRT